MPKHATSTSWEKGKSGNPAGRPKLEVIEYAKVRLAQLSPAALDHLERMLSAIDIDTGEPDDLMRERGMNVWFDRVLGKAVERKELTGADGGKIQIEDSTPSIRLLLQQALPQEVKTIEGEKDE